MIARLLISQSPENIKKEIEKTIPSLSHPDVLYFPSDAKLGIEQARKIKEHFSLKPYSAKGRVAVLEDASVLTLEAQNALLKTLEELPNEGLIVLGASSDASFLPTILSRCKVIRVQDQEDKLEDYEKDIDKLVFTSLPQRFEFIEKLKEKQEFLVALVIYFQKSKSSHNFLKELLQAEEWAKQNVNIRAILEHLMLVMPQKL